MIDARLRASPSAPLAPGTRIAGRYRLGRVLGAGGMGVVYEAFSGEPEARFALKILHRHLVANRQVTARFDREARLLSRLSGERLVELRDFGEDDEGRLFMALTFVDGEALDQHIERAGPPAPARAAAIIVEICEALSVAHAQGIIHRDLKPANVLLERAPEGREPGVRVCDFGMGKALGETGLSSTALTEQNMVFGTPEYMAPEQVRGDEMDARGDIYAAGVLLYELLTGRPPFRAMTSLLTMTAHLGEPPETPSARAPSRGISPALDAVALHALAKAREDRYPSADALARALQRALEAPGDAAAVRPAPLEAPADLGVVDTDLALPPPERPSVPVDPLGSTLAQSLSPIPLPPSSGPAAPRSARPPAPPEPLARPGLTPEPPPLAARPWLWLLVAAVAAALGVGVGLLLSK